MKEVQQARALGEFQGVVAANHIGQTWPEPLDAWVSQHPDWFDHWIPERAAHGHPLAARVFGSQHKDRQPETVEVEIVEHRFPRQVNTGSSGLFAVKAAIEDLGFDRAVLCGIPLSQLAGHIGGTGLWRGAAAYYPGWHEAFPRIKDRVRSMSGWTRELLGAPTSEWIASGC